MNTIIPPLKIIGISGSLRLGSYNRKALALAMSIATNAGMSTQEIDLKELNLPIYDADIEAAGFPDSVQRMRTLVESSDVLLIATPEYNHSISGALKNAIDWLSTTKNILNGKTAAIFGVSTGLFGTMRAQFHLRQILTALNVFLVPQPQVFIRSGKDAFTESGLLRDEKITTQLNGLLHKTFDLARRVKIIN
jgi:chromate reductase, NAD(P)H dehydrogenase (quinone)